MFNVLNNLIHHTSRFIALTVRRDAIDQALLKDVSDIAFNFGIDANVVVGQSVWDSCVRWHDAWNNIVPQTEVERFHHFIECVKQTIKHGGIEFYVDFLRVAPISSWNKSSLKKRDYSSVVKLKIVVEREMGVIENIVITTANLH